MTAPSPLLKKTHPSPVVEAKSWLRGRTFPADKPLIDVSQAAPSDPPPMALRQAMAEAILTRSETHFYGPVLGNTPLREALAADISKLYAGHVSAAHIGITQGCNQAFAVAIQAICRPGDTVMLTVPWYFNHKMWLDMSGLGTQPLPLGPDMMPDPDQARAAITPQTRAIALVSPNNPAGVEYPPALLAAFRNLARDAGIALILDETYRDFSQRSGPPHNLFQDPAWDDSLIHLYSFSKAFRLTGHRVGAIAARAGLLKEMEKILDTVSISASQVGQMAALWGLEHLQNWKQTERAEIAVRRAVAQQQLGQLDGWRLRSAGAYFSWIDHPFEASSDVVAKALVDHANVLSLPGTAFAPPGDPAGQRGLRVAFPNVGAEDLKVLAQRLVTATPLPPL